MTQMCRRPEVCQVPTAFLNNSDTSGPASVRISCLLLFSILYMSTVGLIWEFPKIIIFRTLCFVSKNTAKGVQLKISNLRHKNTE